MALTTERAAAPARDVYLKNILERFPDYQRFTASDFNRLLDVDLRTIMGVFSNHFNPDVLIPKSFIAQYGDDAAGQLMLAVERAAAARNKTELYAIANLNGGIGHAGNVTKGYIVSDVPATITLADGSSHHSTAPKILNYAITQAAFRLMAQNEVARKQGTYTPQTSFTVAIPQEATAAVVAANNNLPQNLAQDKFDTKVGDEMAFMSGYATRAGASDDIGRQTMDNQPSFLCNLDRGVSRIFNSNRADLDAALAWAVGYAQRELDEMPAAQRSTVLASCPAKPQAAAAR